MTAPSLEHPQSDQAKRVVATVAAEPIPPAPISWRRSLPLPAPEKAVLNELVLLCSQSGRRPFAGAERLAEWTGLSVRKVKEAIDLLCILGLITKHKRRGVAGRQGSNEYDVHVGRVLTQEQLESAVGQRKCKRGSRIQGAAGALGPATSRNCSAHIQSAAVGSSSVHRLRCQSAPGSPEREEKEKARESVESKVVACSPLAVDPLDLGAPSARVSHAPDDDWAVAKHALSVPDPSLVSGEVRAADPTAYVARLHANFPSSTEGPADDAPAELRGDGVQLQQVLPSRPDLPLKPDANDPCWRSATTWPCDIDGHPMGPPIAATDEVMEAYYAAKERYYKSRARPTASIRLINATTLGQLRRLPSRP